MQFNHPSRNDGMSDNNFLINMILPLFLVN